jgi:SAM-dependent methyltransferase
MDNQIKFASNKEKQKAVLVDGQNQWGLSDYTLKGLNEISRDVDFSKKNVLELGGWNLPPDITLGSLGARSWICVDMIDSVSGAYQKKRFTHLSDVKVNSVKCSKDVLQSSMSGHFVFDGDGCNLPNWFNDAFDIVISFATLEHVLDVPSFLRNILSSLKPGGVFVTRFGPLWSCYNGHHSWVSNSLNFNNVGQIGDWGHLTHTGPEMFDLLTSSGISFDDAAKAVYQIYTSQRINRYFSEDYISYILKAGFDSVRYSKLWGKHPNEKIKEDLLRLYPKYSDFSTGALYFYCVK